MLKQGFHLICLMTAVLWAHGAFAFEGELLGRPMLTKSEKASFSQDEDEKEDSWKHDVAGIVSRVTNNMLSTDGEAVIDVYTAEELNALEPASGVASPPIQYGRRLAGFGMDTGPLRIVAGYSIEGDDPAAFDDGEGIVIGAGFSDGAWQYSSNFIAGASDSFGDDQSDVNKISFSARYKKSADQAVSLSLQGNDFSNTRDHDLRLTFGFTKKLDFRP